MIADDEPIDRRDMRWLPVRCCCTPKKIFGFLHVPAATGYELRVRDHKGEKHRVQLRKIHEGVPAERAVLSETAIYSEDRPLEFWRTIRGFVEASNA